MKHKYMVGFFDRIFLGYDFSYWKCLRTNGDCADTVSKSFDDHMAEYLREVTNGQVADGLTSFYDDYVKAVCETDDTMMSARILEARPSTNGC
jgi:hypothetical protein